jgi:type IV secretory pathway VirB9-like protein
MMKDTKMKNSAVLSVLILGLVGALAAVPALADNTLYTNGAYNGTINAWNVGYGWVVSDSFTVPANSDIESRHRKPIDRILGSERF